jgi:hypothetical protein
MKIDSGLRDLPTMTQGPDSKPVDPYPTSRDPYPRSRDLFAGSSTNKHSGLREHTVERQMMFDHLLNAPNKHTSGDDYYRQHQTDLQQSELTFTFINPKIKPTIVPFTELNEQNDPSKILKKNPALPAQIEMQDNTMKKECINAPNVPLMKCTHAMQRFIKLNYANREASNYKDFFLTKNNSDRVYSNQIRSFLSVLKNYQLHINNNSGELALNTIWLSKKEITDLKNKIKHWFITKKLLLKRLLINGEPQ